MAPSTSFVVNSVNSQFKYLTASEPGQVIAPGQADEALPEGEPSQINYNNKFISIGEFNALMRMERGSPQHHVLCNTSLSSGSIKLPVPLHNVVDGSTTASCVVCKVPGAPEGQSPSLVSRSITYTASVTPLKKPYEIAWESYNKCSSIKKEKYGKLLPKFCTFMEMCDKSGFKASGIAPGSPGTGFRKIAGPLLNRWHPQRRIQWLAKMHHVSDWYEANRIFGCTLITLTGYQENSGLSFYDTWDNITDSRGKLLKILRKYIGKFDYFWVIEPHPGKDGIPGSGYPHIHLAVFFEVDNNIKDSQNRGMEDKLRDLYSKEWKTGSHTYGLDFKVMKGEEAIVNLKNYLMKYIAKGYVNDSGWSEEELVFNAHIYGATHGYRPPKPGERLNKRGEYTKNYRLIGMSNALSEMLKPDEEEREQVVWLNVDETETKEVFDDDGKIVETEVSQLLYERQLIPDWLDTWRLTTNAPAMRAPQKWIARGVFVNSDPMEEFNQRMAQKIRDGESFNERMNEMSRIERERKT